MRWLSRIGIGKPRLASIDVWQSIHSDRTIGTRHGFNGSLSGPQIDHIRLSSNLQALDARIDVNSRNGRYPSDHFPVVANIRFTNPGYDRRATVASQLPKTPYGTL
jgi:endonuclease/exonuclease/phosphatase family metal-dependent hydrolase